MSRVITFSRFFPEKHPRKGEATNFVEKIWESIYLDNVGSYEYEVVKSKFDIIAHGKYEPKHHTIRAGNRWKVGQKFSPRVWSGKPYASKQIQFAPDIEIKKIWTFETKGELFFVDRKQFDVTSSDLPMNDGLSTDDFLNWFDCHPKKKGTEFSGSILCWNPEIKY